MLKMPAMGSFGQARAYSSDSYGKYSDGPGFGFQSLGSLFTPPPSQGRYSRPRETRAEQETAPKASEAEEQPHRREAQETESPSKATIEEKAARITTEERLQRTMEQELGMFPPPGKPEEVPQTLETERNADSPYGLEAEAAVSRPADSKESRVGNSLVRKVDGDNDKIPKASKAWASERYEEGGRRIRKRNEESGGSPGVNSLRVGRERGDTRRSRVMLGREKMPDRKMMDVKRLDLKRPNPFATRTRDGALAPKEDTEAR